MDHGKDPFTPIMPFLDTAATTPNEQLVTVVLVDDENNSSDDDDDDTLPLSTTLLLWFAVHGCWTALVDLVRSRPHHDQSWTENVRIDSIVLSAKSSVVIRRRNGSVIVVMIVLVILVCHPGVSFFRSFLQRNGRRAVLHL